MSGPAPQKLNGLLLPFCVGKKTDGSTCVQNPLELAIQMTSSDTATPDALVMAKVAAGSISALIDVMTNAANKDAFKVDLTAENAAENAAVNAAVTAAAKAVTDATDAATLNGLLTTLKTKLDDLQKTMQGGGAKLEGGKPKRSLKKSNKKNKSSKKQRGGELSFSELTPVKTAGGDPFSNLFQKATGTGGSAVAEMPKTMGGNALEMPKTMGGSAMEMPKTMGGNVVASSSSIKSIIGGNTHAKTMGGKRK